MDSDYIYEDGTALLVASADNDKGTIECHYIDLRGNEPMKKTTKIHEKARGGFARLTLVRAIQEKNIMFLVATYKEDKGALLFKITATSQAVTAELLLDLNDAHRASLVSVSTPIGSEAIPYTGTFMLYTKKGSPSRIRWISVSDTAKQGD